MMQSGDTAYLVLLWGDTKNEGQNAVANVMTKALRVVSKGAAIASLGVIGWASTAAAQQFGAGTTNGLAQAVQGVATGPTRTIVGERYIPNIWVDPDGCEHWVMDDALIEAHGSCAKLMPYLHLPVQSGSDRILKRMNRAHTAESYLRLIERIRAARPDILMSGDFIVGFPGETEDDFNDTMDLIRHVHYGQAYSFKYSTRPMVGRELTVLVEKPGREPGQMVGKSEYLHAVHIEDCTAPRGSLVKTTITASMTNSLTGRL